MLRTISGRKSEGLLLQAVKRGLYNSWREELYISKKYLCTLRTVILCWKLLMDITATLTLVKICNLL